jgi:hypothetical protein
MPRKEDIEKKSFFVWILCFLLWCVAIETGTLWQYKERKKRGERRARPRESNIKRKTKLCHSLIAYCWTILTDVIIHSSIDTRTVVRTKIFRV